MNRALRAAVLALIVAAVAVLLGAPAATSGPVPTGALAATAEPTGAGVPIMFVFDISSSMAESGDDGVVRLDGAKAAAIDVIYGLPADTRVGVRAYPNDGNCGSGKSLQDVASLDISGVSAEIRALQPGGNTPTAAALTAAVASLKAQGFTSGTIVLASDGEANCDGDPCEVARQIRSEGFDLTVNPTGINISDEGRAQLECIADATGGTYYDAENSADLEAALLAGSQPALRLATTGTAGTARAGSRMVVSATVTNDSTAVPAKDVVLSLTFRTDDDGLPLTALPPTLRLGNIPPGASASRSWRVSIGGSGIARPRVLAQTTNGPPVQVDGEVRVTKTPATLDEAGPLLAHAKRVAILGDSYSSGEGSGMGPDAGSYLSNGTAQDGCHRSLNTYALRLYGIRDGAAVVACSGAVSAEYSVENPGRMRKAQSAYLRDLMDDPKKRPDVVLLTFGGNDIDFAGIVKSCALPTDCTAKLVERPQTPEELNRCLVLPTLNSSDCHPRENWTKRKLADASTLDLSDTFLQVARDIGDATPDGATPVPIIVLPYPQIITNTAGAGCPHLNLAERQFGVLLLQTLDRSIEKSVAEARKAGAIVFYAREVTEAVLPGHTACAADPADRYVNAISVGDALTPSDAKRLSASCVTGTPLGPVLVGGACLLEYVSQVSGSAQQLMHPNTPGYRAETDSIVDWSVLPDVTAAWQADTKRAQPRHEPIFLELPVPLGPSTDVDLLQGSTVDPHTLPASTDIHVTADGFAANSDVQIVVRSTPTAIGLRKADAHGVLRATVTLPTSVAAGDHHLTVEGIDPAGDPRLVSAALRVTPPTPLWVVLVLVASLIVLGTAGTLWLAGRRQHQRPGVSTPKGGHGSRM